MFPPAGSANYAWIQHILSKVAPGGKAGVVMANGSMSSNAGGEGDIRARIVEADLVSCMIALPAQLFRSTGIPVCLWFFATDKADRSGQVLFIDARGLGYLVDRAERALTDDEIARIGDTYHAWCGSASAAAKSLTYQDVPGFCKSVWVDDSRTAGYPLTPGRYVGAPAVDDDGEPVDEKIARLTEDLLAALDESARFEFVVLRPIGVDTSALWLAVRHRDVLQRLQQQAAGTSGSRQRIQPGDLFDVPVRDVRRLSPAASRTVTGLGALCHARRAECLRISAFRDALLPLLMSGQVPFRPASSPGVT